MATVDSETTGSRPVAVGDRAPDFALPNANGETVRLSDFLGKKSVVLYFYPKDETTGCTAEACAFRDSYQDFTDAGAEVIGVSSDSMESHQGFAAHHRLPFILLSDSDGALRKLYGAPDETNAYPGRVIPGRVTYVIDKDGIVRHVFNSLINATAHITESLQTLQTM